MSRLLNLIISTGSRILDIIDFAGYSVVLFFKSVFYTKNVISKRREIIKQIYISLVKTFGVVSIVAMFTGMILALQTGIELKKFNLEDRVGNLLVATLTREMGPFTSAIILIASVGSAMAAEIGTMKVSEEIDALTIMSISPVKFLVMPRIVALSIVLPIVTIYTDTLGCIGGAIIAKAQLNVSYGAFYQNILESLHLKAIYVGLLKAYIFGVIISSISCAHGLRAMNGAMGVGKATRDSVVTSFIMVLIVGYIITAIFYGL